MLTEAQRGEQVRRRLMALVVSSMPQTETSKKKKWDSGEEEASF
jgi:hypothetical protein